MPEPDEEDLEVLGECLTEGTNCPSLEDLHNFVQEEFGYNPSGGNITSLSSYFILHNPSLRWGDRHDRELCRVLASAARSQQLGGIIFDQDSFRQEHIWKFRTFNLFDSLNLLNKLTFELNYTFTNKLTHPVSICRGINVINVTPGSVNGEVLKDA